MQPADVSVQDAVPPAEGSTRGAHPPAANPSRGAPRTGVSGFFSARLPVRSMSTSRRYLFNTGLSLSNHSEDSEDESTSLDSSHPSFRDDGRATLPPVLQQPNASDAVARSPQARAVLALKLVLVAFLLGLGAGLGAFSFQVLHAAEVSKFEGAFNARVAQALHSLSSGYVAKTQAGALLAAHVGVLTKRLGLPPERNYEASQFVDFASTFNKSLNSLAVSRLVLWAPLINATSLPAFATFAAADVPTFEGAGSVALQRAAFGPWRTFDGYTLMPLNATQPFFVPVLHVVPFLRAQQFVLLDLFGGNADMRHALSAVLQTGLPHQTDLLPLPDSSGAIRASSILFSPIFKAGHEGEASAPGAGDGTAIIGFAGVVFAWGDMVFDVLSQARETGVLARVTSPSGRVAMFSLQGGSAQEIDANAMRDEEFERYEQQLTGTFGPGWAVDLWPARQLYDKYISSAPTIEAVVVAMVVVFVCFVFGVYDFVAATRAALLTRMWQATEAVVADVFPHSIKSRLVQEQLSRRRRAEKAAAAPSILSTAAAAVSSALDRRMSGMTAALLSAQDIAAIEASLASVSADDTAAGESGSAESPLSGFIADAYPAATVIFADIVGFTEWSASVTPAEVFRVLEAVFMEFDALAKSLGVFKVETSYMACCGCPDAYEDHAQRAADFALGLAGGFARAGAATGVTHLCCRVGLHSGPVVAGVLRAEKHRFQLFGDTVNTASRMESTGEPRRVQCSEATATLLLHSARHTLRRRGVIAVKGKGSIVTFWVTGRLGRHRGDRPRRTQSAISSSIPGEALSTDEAARRAASAADDLITIVVAEAAGPAAAEAAAAEAAVPVSCVRLSAASDYDEDTAGAVAAAHTEPDAALAVLVALDVTEGGYVRVIIDDSVIIDTSPGAVAESMSLGRMSLGSPLGSDVARVAAAERMQ